MVIILPYRVCSSKVWQQMSKTLQYKCTDHMVHPHYTQRIHERSGNHEETLPRWLWSMEKVLHHHQRDPLHIHSTNRRANSYLLLSTKRSKKPIKRQWKSEDKRDTYRCDYSTQRKDKSKDVAKKSIKQMKHRACFL